jgi:ataxia telangiectasia mutated family protein
VSEARLEKPDIIIKQYFEPALLASRKESGGAASGSALHIYATFCHDQLDNPEVIEELRRAEKLHATKVAELQALGPSQNSQAAQALAVWRDIYAKDLQRLQSDRETFIRKSLNCYLECLATTDKHDIDVVRFTSLWLQHSDNEDATVEIRDRIDRVPSRKFATLMHQLASRLQRDAGTFQQVLKRLVEKICTEHPYHSMNHVYASYQNANSKDSQTQSRQAAATEIVSRLASGAKTSDLWARLSKSNTYYTNLANHKPDKNDPNAAHVRNNIYRYRENCKIVLDKVTWSRRMKRDVPSCKLPPITMSVMINMRSDYSNVPVITQFEDTMSILGGVSAPKLLSERLSNGLMHKELVCGGDYSQDLAHADSTLVQRRLG